MNTSRSALPALTRKTLEDENRRYMGRGGISEEIGVSASSPPIWIVQRVTFIYRASPMGAGLRSICSTDCQSHWSWDERRPARSLPSRAR